MRLGSIHHTLLGFWAIAAGLSLWAPAFGITVMHLPLQPMDLTILAGFPLLLIFARRFASHVLWVIFPLTLSIGTAWIVMGGQLLIVVWTLVFALPFVSLMTLVFQNAHARIWFLSSFFFGALASAALFFAQIFYDAEQLDWRSNIAFRLPPHFGRGFALFPEVSTFAIHIGIAFGMCVALLMHLGTEPKRRRNLAAVLLISGTALLFSRSTSVLIILPMLLATALILTTRLSLNTVLGVIIVTALFSGFLIFFVQVFYSDRLAGSSATRSASMRLASILGGLSPLWQGEIFGVGIGENYQVTRRAYDISREIGLRFGKLPDGINSQIVGRIFEEGWPAAMQMLATFTMLLRSRASCRENPELAALYVLAIGSFLSALLVTGYRGIYTNWIWLSAAAAWSQTRIPQRSNKAIPCMGG